MCVWGVWAPVGVIPVGVPHTPHLACPEKKGGLAAMLLAYQPTVRWGGLLLIIGLRAFVQCFRRRKAAGFMRKLSVKSHEQQQIL